MKTAPKAVAVVLIASIGLLSACSSTPTDDTATTPASSGLDIFYEQDVAFEPCDAYATTDADRDLYAGDRFDCARVSVPLDYADPDGERGTVALLRAKARGEKIGSLLINPGGPGGSGMNLAAALGPVWDASPVGERFDVIGFDPRGVGASEPSVHCYTDDERDANDPPAPYLFPVQSMQDAQGIADACLDGTGGIDELTSVGSDNVVQDMDVMRAALGDEKLNYLGYSYGSELGAMYAQRYPDNVRAVVLDGAVHPGLREAPFRETQFTAFQRAFDGMAELCATDATCALGTDPSQATAAFHALVRPLVDTPLATPQGRSLTWDDAIQGVSLALFDSEQWPLVISALGALAAGDGAPLLAMRDASYGRSPAGEYSGGLSTDANLAIRCADNPRTEQEQNDLLLHAREAAPFMDPGTPATESVYECAAWPEPSTRELPWITDGVEAAPTLVVSALDDPGTPHQGAIAMADILDATLLSVEAARHGVAFTGGSVCVDTIVTDYLVDLESPAQDTVCSM